MDLFDTSIVGIEKAMQGSLLRQQVLANNLANANTPGFKRSDVDFQSALAQASRQRRPRRPADQTTGFSPQTDSHRRDARRRQQRRRRHRDGDLSENTLDYQALDVGAWRTRMSILETAIGSAS